MGSREFIHDEKRWCLWLVNADPSELKKMPLVLNRIEKVKKMREASVDEGARKLANRPSQFRDTNNPDQYIIVPSVSSEHRKYIPIGFLNGETIPTNLVHIIPDGNIFHFGVLNSEMHMTWVKYVCGRLKSDYRYSNSIVYNNFPWPQALPQQKIQGVEKHAQHVLNVRERYPESSLADLYDPLTMPPDLVRAHQDLDKFVDTCYRSQPFTTEMQRIEFLFDLYKKYTQPLFGEEKKRKEKKSIKK